MAWIYGERNKHKYQLSHLTTDQTQVHGRKSCKD